MRLATSALVTIAVVLTLCLRRGAAHSAEIQLFDYKGGGWAEVTGEILDGDSSRLSAALAGRDWNSIAIYLNSPGGVAIEGIRMGVLARSLSAATVVGNRVCASACALAWLGGVQRLAMPTARVGFHSVYTVEGLTKKRSLIGNAVVTDYVRSIGLPERAAEYVVQADPDRIEWISKRGAASLGIDFYMLDPKLDVIPYRQQ